MTAIFTLFMGKMVLVVEIEQPLLMSGKPRLPRSVRSKCQSASLLCALKFRLDIRLPSLPLFDLMLLDA
jgi:hypothetical protein